MDELGQKLLWTTLQPETLKSEAEEEIRNNKVYVENLIYLLKQAIQERDEARDQLQNLGNKTMLSSTDPENSSTLSHESRFDTVSSTEFLVSRPELGTARCEKYRPGFDDHRQRCKRESFASKGEVPAGSLEARPLLETLVMDGPLPSLQNPPMAQLFQVPPDSPKCLDGVCSSVFTQTRPASSVGRLGRSRCSPMACRTSRVSSNMLNFTHVPAVSCLSSSCTLVPLAKRQRFC